MAVYCYDSNLKLRLASTAQCIQGIPRANWADYNYCDNSQLCSFCIQYEPAVPVMAQHPTTKQTGTVVSSVSHLCRYECHKIAVRSSISCFTQAWWQVFGPLQFHCFSRLILFYSNTKRHNITLKNNNES